MRKNEAESIKRAEIEEAKRKKQIASGNTIETLLMAGIPAAILGSHFSIHKRVESCIESVISSPHPAIKSSRLLSIVSKNPTVCARIISVGLTAAMLGMDKLYLIHKTTREVSH